MSDQRTELQRYEGMYKIEWAWLDGRDITRYLHVKAEGDRLTVAHEIVSIPIAGGIVTRDDPVVDHSVSESYSLQTGADHTFDAASLARSYRFVLGDEGDAESVIVIRDGQLSEPGPRFVALPKEMPGRRERGEWIDLGHASLCMTAKDTQELASFYEKLGFVRAPDMPGVLRQGFTALAFLGFQPQPCINYRGAHVADTAFELARRGYTLAAGQVEASHVQGDGAGAFMLYDPDGHRMFFNTHALERADYEAWKDGTLAPGEGSHYNTRDTMLAPETLPLGALVVCLDVTDLAASVAFYRGLGFEVIDETPGSATLFSHPVRDTRYSFPVRLRSAEEPRYSFGFLSDDVDAVATAVRARGIETIDTADGPAFVDPDGNIVALMPARRSRS